MEKAVSWLHSAKALAIPDGAERVKLLALENGSLTPAAQT